MMMYDATTMVYDNKTMIHDSTMIINDDMAMIFDDTTMIFDDSIAAESKAKCSARGIGLQPMDPIMIYDRNSFI